MKDKNMKLTEQQKSILFKEETEAPGSSDLNYEKREGAYHCVNCCLLYTSDAADE